MIGKRKNKKTKIPKIISDTGQEITDPLAISNQFNNFFANIGKNMAEKLPNRTSSTQPNNTLNSFVFTKISSDEIEKIIDRLDTKKSVINNSIPVKFLKMTKFTISPYLAYLFNRCIESGKYPDILKIAQVVPIYKNKGSKTDCSNYRPISLLSPLNKILEKLIYQRIIKYLDKYKLLTNHQYGFRQNSSTAQLYTT